MVKKLMILLSLILVLLIGVLVMDYYGVNLESFLNKKFGLIQNPSDCKENQYYDASKHRCKKIINECYTDDDCSGDETCVKEVIRTHLACQEGQECPSWYHNICRLTEETKRHCEQDSDCGIQGNCCCIRPLNKKYIQKVTCNKKDIICSPCAWSPDYVLAKCVNNQCTFVPKTAHNTTTNR